MPLATPASGTSEDDGDPPSPDRFLAETEGLDVSKDGFLEAEAFAHRSTQAAVSSEIGEGLGWIAGSGIAVLTLLIPLGSVLIDREAPLSQRRTAPVLASPVPPLHPAARGDSGSPRGRSSDLARDQGGGLR